MQGRLLVAIFASGICLAQSDPPLRLGPFYNLQKPAIQALVELPTDENVAAHDFELIEDGRITVHGASLSKFRDSSWKAALVLALDMSHSISSAELDNIKHAAIDFVTRIKDPVALIAFADNADVLAGFDTSRDGLIEAISRLRPSGRYTRLSDALDRALGLLETRLRPERQRIVVISDGVEDSQAAPDSIDSVLQRAEQRLIPIDTVWVPTSVAGARNTMRRASENTGGLRTDAREYTDILAGLLRVSERIDRSVIVTFKRSLDSSRVTKEVGIGVDKPGISSASTQLPITASALAAEFSWLAFLHSLVGFLTDMKTLYALLGLGGLWQAVASWIKWRFGRQIPSPESFVIWILRPDHDDDTKNGGGEKHITETPISRKNRRVTTVDHGGDPAPAQGLALKAVKGPFEGRRIPVETDRFRIGADPDSDLRIASDDYVSGRHAVIQAAEGRWLLVDEGSRNGTFLDGRKVERGPGQVLRPGDSIQVGTSEFQVILDEGARAAGASARYQ